MKLERIPQGIPQAGGSGSEGRKGRATESLCCGRGSREGSRVCQDIERRVNRSKLFENDIIRLNTWHAN